uniref:Uncharacterized protein n=1 Tax=Papio anubis TaxID=9555 RepID=A0A8I5R9P7_PAPAN
MQFSNSSCLFSPSYNSTEEIDLGHVAFSNCTSITNVTGPICAVNGSVFLCGNNMAYTYLPTNWTGLCVLATLLPDIDIIPGDEPVPIPAIDHFIYRPKRAIQFIPLLAGLGITTAFTTGATSLGVSVTQYTKLSNQLISDVQILSSTIQDLQDQVDSLAEVVLQNRRGLDLLTAEQGGIQIRDCERQNKNLTRRTRKTQKRSSFQPTLDWASRAPPLPPALSWPSTYPLALTHHWAVHF